MPTTNYTAGYITQRRQAKTLSGYNTALQNEVSNGTTVLREQSGGQLLSVITQRRQGNCFCTNDNTDNTNDTASIFILF